MARSGRAPDTPPPAFQFYPGDFLADEHVDSMTLAERGAYITLLCHAWRSGSIPCTPPQLARMLHISRGAMAKLWPNISPCWVPGAQGRLVQPRLERERAVQAAYRSDRAANGRKGAAKRWPGYSDPNAEPIANDGSSSSSSPSDDSASLRSAGAAGSENGKAKKKPRKKAKPSGDHAAFIGWWTMEWERIKETVYAFDGGKDGAHVKAILKHAGTLAAAKARATLLLESDDPFYVTKGIDLGTLRSQWNRLGSAGKGRSPKRDLTKGSIPATHGPEDFAGGRVDV